MTFSMPIAYNDSYTPFTRSSSYQAKIEQASSRH